MKTLVFATQNPNKIKEIQLLLTEKYEVKGLEQTDITEEIPETGDTLEANAIQKAEYVYHKTGMNCFADDTGLEVTALGGAPGVYTARYAGPEKDADKNMKKLLYELEGESNRKAQFKTVIALIVEGEVETFEGIAKGTIAETTSGHEGFGYDPVFIPEGYEITFAQMSLKEKNKLSHRAKAIEKLTTFLSEK